MNGAARSKETRANAFLVTKPLQIIIALSIINQLNIADTSTIIIVDSFAGARGVSERLPSLQKPVSGLSSTLVLSTAEAYRYLRQHNFSAVFIDSDVGLRKYGYLLSVWLNNYKVDISVYEEGIGTYRTDLYQGMRRLLFPVIGAGSHFGGCLLTSSIYLTRPKSYMKSFPRARCAIIPIEKGPSALVDSSFEDISLLFQHTHITSTSSKQCNIYLSSWVVDKEFLSGFRSLDGDNYIKLHPHIKEVENNSAIILDQFVPAEVIIVDLMKKYEVIYVYHHGSSVEDYIWGESVHYIRI